MREITSHPYGAGIRYGTLVPDGRKVPAHAVDLEILETAQERTITEPVVTG